MNANLVLLLFFAVLVTSLLLEGKDNVDVDLDVMVVDLDVDVILLVLEEVDIMLNLFETGQ